jgi:zinc D-Ala-D-Ala carboxypeptidase
MRTGHYQSISNRGDMVLMNKNEADTIVYRIDQSQPRFKLSRNFELREFASRCGSFQILVHPALIVGLQELRDVYGKPIKILSGYRTIGHNARIGGAPNSYHTKGMAADIQGEDLPLIAKLAKDIGFVTKHYVDKNFVHVDVGHDRNW